MMITMAYYESNPWLTCRFHTIAIISLLAFYLTLLTHKLIIISMISMLVSNVNNLNLLVSMMLTSKFRSRLLID